MIDYMDNIQRMIAGTVKGADKPKPLTCCHCGKTGKDVENFTVYVGGQGNVQLPECVNVPDCLNRIGWQVTKMRRK